MDARYWAAATRAFARNLRNRTFLKQVAEMALVAEGSPVPASAGGPRARSTHFLLAYPDAANVSVDLGKVSYQTWNMDPMERFCIGALVKLRQPRAIFEFGTFDGTTTEVVAKCAPEAEVFTLDISPDAGARLDGAPDARRITRLTGDSITFNFEPYVGKMDMVIVDGGHNYECARSDTANALRMLMPGGLLIWDDYAPAWPGVVRAVDEAADRNELGILSIAGTELVVHDRGR